MTRTPIGRAVVTLAAVQSVACRLGVPAAVIRDEWARAREGTGARPVGGRHARAVSRRAFLLGGGAAGAWLALGADRLAAAQTPAPAKKKAAAAEAAGHGGHRRGGTRGPVRRADASRRRRCRHRVRGRRPGRRPGALERDRLLAGQPDQRVVRGAHQLRPSDDPPACPALRAPDAWTSMPARRPGSEDAFHVLGAPYPVADADRDFQAVYPLLRRDLAAAGDETTHKTRTPAGMALDRMSIREWIDARVPGGASSRLGRLLDVGYALEYGAPATDQSALNLVYLLGEQPPGRAAVAHGHVRRALPDRRAATTGCPRAIARALPKDAVRLRMAAPGARARGGRPGRPWTSRPPDGPKSVRADHVILALPFAVLRGLDYARAGFDPLKRRAIEELGMGRNSKLHLQLSSRSWRRPDAARPGTGVVATDRGPLLTWESSRGQSGGSGLLVCYGLDEASGAVAAPLPWGDAGAHSHVADVARSTLGGPRDGMARRHPEWNGLATLSVPFLDPNVERLVLLLPRRAVSGVRRLRGRPAAQHPLRRRAHVTGVPGVHGGGGRRGGAGGPGGPGRSPPGEAAPKKPRR